MEQFTSPLEQGAMEEVPIYESHRRGTNYLAKIWTDPSAPGGLGREFCRKAHGDYYYFVTNLKVGDPVEFGADYTSSGGNKNRRRRHGVVVEITDDHITFDITDGYKEAIKHAKELNQQV